MPEEKRAALIISSPDDAWAILGEIAAGRFDPVDYRGLLFEGWECELMRISHIKRQSIPIPVMRAFLEYQNGINKSYHGIVYGDYSKARLKREQKSRIEMSLVVLPNGSSYTSAVKDVLSEFAKAAGERMESKHIAITAIAVTLIFAAGYFGNDAFKAYVASQKEAHTAEVAAHEVVQLSEQETERAKILGALVSDNVETRKALLRVEAGYQSLLRGAATVGGARVLGVDISEDMARNLTAKPRRVGEGMRLDGEYEVADMSRESDGLYTVQLVAQSAKPVTADARSLFLPDNQIDLLLASLKTGRLLKITMNAWTRGGNVTAAEIVRVDER